MSLSPANSFNPSDLRCDHVLKKEGVKLTWVIACGPTSSKDLVNTLYNGFIFSILFVPFEKIAFKIFTNIIPSNKSYIANPTWARRYLLFTTSFQLRVNISWIVYSTDQTSPSEKSPCHSIDGWQSLFYSSVNWLSGIDYTSISSPVSWLIFATS